MSSPHTVLIVEDSELTRDLIERTLHSAGYTVVAASNVAQGRELIESHVIDLAFLDLNLGDDDGTGGRSLLAALQETAPDVPAIIVTADNSAGTAIDLLRRGAYDYAVKPVPPEALLRLARRGIELCTARRALALAGLRDAREEAIWDVGETPRMRTVEQLVNKFAPTEAGILIQGESGTGKEVVARILHARSKRPDGAFIAVNCAALPAQLLESELFGHEKGSFTGAFATRRGLLELAHRGTLFLDEVTMMSSEMQAKLLRALQEFKFRRVGGHNEIHVDVRVISASNRGITEAVEMGDFREDLFYRLCVMTIELPPLRARAVDIPFFAEKLLAQMREEMGSTVTGVTEAALWALCRYHWPGNIRELRNVIERAMILANGEARIDVVHLPEQVRAAEDGLARPGRDSRQLDPAGRAGLPTALPAEGIDLKEVAGQWERLLIQQALARTGGNQTSAARLLGLTRDELRYRLEKIARSDPRHHAA